MAENDATMENLGDPNAMNEPLLESVDARDDAAEPMDEGVAAIQELPAPLESSSEDSTSGSYEWTIFGFGTTTKHKEYSDTFHIGGHPWRLLIFPRGNKNDAFLAIYLDCADSEITGPGWQRRAHFKLCLLNTDPTKSIHKDAVHNFHSGANDWGFTQFCSIQDVADKAKGFLVEDAIKIRVEVKVERPDQHLYDSRKETGYVGLKNQGATCYMNSLLQTLYNINYFRQAVYHMPTTEEDLPHNSIPLALQSLFYKLQYSPTSVATKDLTKSFGWTSYDAFMQHDVQELNRVLCEKLEEKMKGTKVEGVIAKLFEGHTFNFIECVNVDYKSTRKASYMDLQLDVKGCKNIYDSFDKYTEVEMLEGENQYEAEGHGKQDAKMGVLFESFPPVLQLQLKRFEYDFQRDMMVKINDRYEFAEELDLDVEDGKYLSATADRSVRNKYRLHSVLVHSGGVHGGHYYAFIRPDGRQWLKFDDDKVTKETPQKAMNEQFGGEDENPAPAPGFNNAHTFKFTKYSNAYMLVYVRESDWPSIMCEVTEHDIAEHVRARLQREREEKERKKKEKQEAHLYTVVRVARDEDFREQIGVSRYFDLVEPEKVASFRVKKQAPFSEFKVEVERELGIPAGQQRYWLWSRRQNNTLRPARILTGEEEAGRVMDIRDPPSTWKPANVTNTLNLYLETPVPPQTSLPPKTKMEIFLFLKLYDPATSTLSYVGRFFSHKNTKVQDLLPLMRRLAGLPDEAEVEVYEEIKFEPTVMCEKVDRKQTLGAAQLEDGDILCVQRAVPPEKEAEFSFPRVKNYLDYMRNRQVVIFKKLEEPKEEGLQLELSREMSYDQVAEALAAAIQLDDPARLRLTQHNCYSQAPKPSPIKWRGYDTLADMLAHYNQQSNVLYYEALDIPLPELERLKTLKVLYHGSKAEQVSVQQVRLPKESTVADVLEELRGQLGAAMAGRPMRLLEIFYCKIYKVFDPAEKIENINDQYWEVRAEEVPADEVEPKASDRIIHVYHYNVDQNNHVTNFGDPFLFRIGEDETVASIRRRIQAKLGLPEPEFAAWKVAFVSSLRPPEPLGLEDVPASRFQRQGSMYGQTGETAYLGLEHPDTHPRRHHNHNRFNHYERPVKIYN